MEEEFVSEKENSEDRVTNHDKNNVLKFLLKLGVIIFLVLLCILAIYLLLRVDKKSPKQNRDTTSTYQPSKTPHVRNQFETNKTQIATSLEVPPLYPDVEWIEEVVDSNDGGLNEAWVYDDFIKVPFKGHYWSSKSLAEVYSVERYYSNILSNMGWVGPDADGMSLKFNSFKLAGISADAACVGAIGFLGYREGFVRLLTIKYSSNPCHPLGLPDATPYPSNTKFYSDYTIFISEPMRIEEIVEYARPSEASRS